MKRQTRELPAKAQISGYDSLIEIVLTAFNDVINYMSLFVVFIGQTTLQFVQFIMAVFGGGNL